MATLKDSLRADLTAAMRARDELRTATLRLTLAAVQAEEVSGPVARALSDDEVLAVLRRELKRRREAAEAFRSGGRPELAAREEAEGAVLAGYLPSQLGDAALEELAREALAASGATTIGPAMKAVQAAVAGRADGARVAAVVRRLLGS
ncbi:MAG: GatB/YqeY domain-containing protein [Mycobacteriales bacterium]